MSAVTRTVQPRLGHTFVTPQEVVEMIPGLTVKKLAEWRYEHRGPRYRKLGRLVLYAIDELEAWIEASAMEGGDDAH